MPVSASVAEDGTVSGWQVELPDGREFEWTGFYTGPEQMAAEDIALAAYELLDLKVDAVAAAAAELIVPAANDNAGPAIILHSATPVLMTLAGDLDSMVYGRTPEDVATFVETRAVYLARPGDLVVGRTQPWRMAAKLAGIEAIEIPQLSFYYLSQAIIQVLLTEGVNSAPIARMIRALRQSPDTVVRVYCLDLETQIVLLYLRRAAGIERILTDANSPEVGGRWNAKAPLHPCVTDAEALSADGIVPLALLDAETELAPLRRSLGTRYERLPGYALDAEARELPEITERLLLAARLLRQRYSIEVGCLKPSAGAGGNRITTDLRLADEDVLQTLAVAIWRTGEEYLLEAQVSYLPVKLGQVSMRLNPSAHVRDGHLAQGVTLQLSQGTSWQGNIYLDGPAWIELGLAVEHYEAILKTVHEFHAAFANSGQALVTGGIDFAVGTVGGAFHDHVFVAAQDPNLSSHGAEFLRRYLDGREAGGYAATKVICPSRRGSLWAVQSRTSQGFAGHRSMICSVPGRWGMIAAAGDSPAESLMNVLSFEDDLINLGLAVKPNH